MLEATCVIDDLQFVFYGGRPNDYTYGRGVVSNENDTTEAKTARLKGSDYEVMSWFCSFSAVLSQKVMANAEAQQQTVHSENSLPEVKRLKALLYGKRYQALRERRTSTITASQFSVVKAVWKMAENDLVEFNLSKSEAKTAKHLAEMIMTDLNQQRVIYKGFSPVRQFPGNPGTKR
jgi:hypothetical protein